MYAGSIERAGISQGDPRSDTMEHTHATTTATQEYRAYLLRLWRQDAGAPWRCSLQAVDTVERL